MTGTDIRAAGGLLWRAARRGAVGADGEEAVEVALVHRLRYDDWSLPKGKLDGGEEPLLAAVREIGEETGRTVEVGRRLATVRYDVGNRAKAVQYWTMRDTGPWGTGEIVDTDEVAELEWLTPDAAAARLTYPDDRTLLAQFRRTPRTTSVLVLVRHARAGRRSRWQGPDEQRPLDPRGEEQAAALADLLGVFRPSAVYAANRVRCVQTVAPLAARLGCVPEVVPAVSDESYVADPAATRDALAQLAAGTRVAVVCSQGTAIPGLLADWLPSRVRATLRTLETRKAAWWVVGLCDGVPVWTDRYDRPATIRRG